MWGRPPSMHGHVPGLFLGFFHPHIAHRVGEDEAVEEAPPDVGQRDVHEHLEVSRAQRTAWNGWETDERN